MKIKDKIRTGRPIDLDSVLKLKNDEREKLFLLSLQHKTNELNTRKLYYSLRIDKAIKNKDKSLIKELNECIKESYTYHK